MNFSVEPCLDYSEKKDKSIHKTLRKTIPDLSVNAKAENPFVQKFSSR